MSLATELDPPRFHAAWERVRHPGGAGVDGLCADQFQRDLQHRLRALRASVLSGRYQPGGLLRRTIPKASGGQRHLAIPTLGDRLVQAAVLPSVVARAELLLLPGVHGFRPGRSPGSAVRHLCREVGVHAHLELTIVDVADMFDSLPTQLVDHAATLAWGDPLWARLVQRWSRRWSRAHRGVPQGAPLSPLLANLALHQAIDRHLDAPLRIGQPAAWIRYADDFALVSTEHGGALGVGIFLRGLLRRAGLRINPDKTRIAVSGRAGGLPITLLGEGIQFVRQGPRWSLQAICTPPPLPSHRHAWPFAVRQPFPAASLFPGGEP